MRVYQQREPAGLPHFHSDRLKAPHKPASLRINNHFCARFYDLWFTQLMDWLKNRGATEVALPDSAKKGLAFHGHKGVFVSNAHGL